MLTRKTPLARSPMSRHTPLATTSPAHRRAQASQQRAYREAAVSEDPWCVCCGRPGSTDHSHLLSQGRFKAHRNNPLNWLKKCRACHDLFEDDKAAFAAQFPAVWAEILRRLPLIDAAAYAEFLLKHDY